LPPQTLCNTAQERGIKSGIGMSKPPLTVCVVGGGFTGAAAAIACLSHLKAPFRLVMIEGPPPSGAGSPMAAITRSIFSMCVLAISQFAQVSPAIS
jgi:uncharacterized NAD(P)/FAD-binding protein YdhS